MEDSAVFIWIFANVTGDVIVFHKRCLLWQSGSKLLDILISFLADFIFVVISTGLFGMVEQNILMIL